MAGAVPSIVVLALGAGALGGPDALRLLVEVAGRNPVVDIGICVFVFSIFAAQLFGTALLARFVRKAAPGAGRGAAAADPFAQVTLLLSLAVAFLVAACLALVSGGQGCVRRLLVDLAAEYYPVAIAAAAAGAALHYYTMPLLRNFRERRNAPGAAPTERATMTRTRRAVGFAGLPLVAAVCAVAIPFAAHGGPDAPRLSPGFTNMPVAVAVATVVGATLLVRLYRGARNGGAVGGGGGATRAPAKAPRVRGASAT